MIEIGRSANPISARWVFATLIFGMGGLDAHTASAQSPSNLQTRRAVDYAGPGDSLADAVAAKLRGDLQQSNAGDSAAPSPAPKPTRLGTADTATAQAAQMLPPGCTGGWLPTEMESFAYATAAPQPASPIRLAASKKPALRVVPSRARLNELDALDELKTDNRNETTPESDSKHDLLVPPPKKDASPKQTQPPAPDAWNLLSPRASTADDDPLCGLEAIGPPSPNKAKLPPGGQATDTPPKPAPGIVDPHAELFLQTQYPSALTCAKCHPNIMTNDVSAVMHMPAFRRCSNALNRRCRT